MIAIGALMAIIWLFDDELSLHAEIDLHLDDIAREQGRDMAFVAAIRMAHA